MAEQSARTGQTPARHAKPGRFQKTLEKKFHMVDKLGTEIEQLFDKLEGCARIVSGMWFMSNLITGCYVQTAAGWIAY